MHIQTTITQKGQLTIPQDLRKRYNIRTYDRVYLEAADHFIKIIPVRDILDLAGTFKPKKNKQVSILKAREEMEKNYKRR